MSITHRGDYEWVIDEAILTQMKSAKRTQEFKSAEFEIGPTIKWHLACYPKGNDEASTTDNCQLHLVSASFPEHMTRIIVYYELHCAETISNFVGIKSFDKLKESNKSTCWFRGILRSDELTKLPPATKQLHFKCTINILRIESKAKTCVFEYPLNIDFKRKSQFVLNWKLNNEVLDTFLTVPHGKFLCDHTIHDGLWSLQCAPDGFKSNDRGSVRLFMQLCALPIGIKSITLTRKLECIERHVEKESAKQVPWGYNKDDGMRLNSGWGKGALLRKDVCHLKEITFRATINILSYITSDDKKVDIVCDKTEEKADTSEEETEEKASKKRKRSPSPVRKKIVIDVDDGNIADAEEEEEEKKVDEKPPKKKRKKVKKDKEAKENKRAVKKKDKEEATSDEEDSEEVKVAQVKRIEMNDKISGEYEWKISKDLLEQFKSAKYRKCWQSEEFIVRDLKWMIEVFPAGHNKSDKDEKSVMVFLTMITPLSDQVAKMTVCYTLYTKPSLCCYTTISEFTAKKNSFGFCGGLLSQKELSEMQNTFDTKIAIGVKLTVLNTMDGNDVKKKLYTQIYPLQIKNNEDGISGEDNECFNRKCRFEWKVAEKEMDLFKKAYNGKCFESSTFNGNMWCLRCAPNGDKKEDEGKVDLWLQLNSFPKGIAKMKVLFELKCLETKKRAYLVHNYNVTKSVAGWDCNILKTEDIQALDSMTFSVLVDIQMFYDTNNKLIKTL